MERWLACSDWLLFAQNGDGGGFSTFPILIGVLLLLFYFMLIRPEKQKQKHHQQMLDSLKKNDRVVTVGGIYGVVMNVQREKDEVTLRVDESNNTKIPFTVASIARVISGNDTGKEKSG